MPVETLYAPRYSTPDWLIRGESQTIALPVERNGGLAIPTSGTITLLNASQTAVVDAAAVTITGGIATYALSATDIPVDEPLSTTWYERWTLVMPDGRTYTFGREAHIVRSRIYPLVTQGDLERRHTELRRWLAEDRSNAQHYIDDAWDDVLVRLMEDGRHPYLVLSPWALRPALRALALANLFFDYATSASSDGKYADTAAYYREQYDNLWSRITLTYDTAEDGAPSESEQGQGVEPPIFLAAPTQSWGWS